MAELLEHLRSMPAGELPGFAETIRKKIIESVSRNGGHLASSCGCVELIVALHRVFDTPREKIFFDVGHQAYAHKILTGREDGFDRLRRIDGVSGFPNPAESVFDPATAGHAGTALSAALGHCAAAPDDPARIIAVIGDGAMGCGVTFEALNNASSLPGSRRLIVILNDNRMSISRNVGALSQALNRVMAARSYNRFRRFLKKLVRPLPRVKDLISRIDDAGKSVLLPPSLFFGTLGFRYFGAIDGNDLGQLIPTLRRLKEIDGPVLLHVITRKGYGCEFAESDPTRYHGIAGCDPDTGEMKVPEYGFSQAFSRAMVALGERDPRIVAVTPAMLEGTGLAAFAAKFPDRCIDTGISEEHAITFAAGLAAAGKRPVCAFYDTFLQRSLDGIYHDAALSGSPLVIASDRAGAVADGPTHHGIYNCGFLRALPGVAVFSPASEAEMLPALEFALSLSAPAIVRYPKGQGRAGLAAEPFVLGKSVIRRGGDGRGPVLWAIGAEVSTALDAAEILAGEGISCTVADARFLKPFDAECARGFSDRLQFVIEDHVSVGGLFSALAEALAGVSHRPVYGFGWSADEVIPHGEVALLREKAGLTAREIAQKILSRGDFF